MLTMDFAPLFRSAIGFERLTPLIDAAFRAADTADPYPPYNIERTDDNAYRITLAVAGFTPADIKIETRENTLVVTGGAKNGNGGTAYLHRGIAGRAIERRFHLADFVEVESAALENGLLRIDLVRNIPEAMRPRTIPIRGGVTTAIDGKPADNA